MSKLDIFMYCLLISYFLSISFPFFKDESGEIHMSKIDLKAIKKSYGTDLNKELEGVWFKSSVISGLEFKIAKSGNPAYEKLVRKLYKPYAKQLRKGVDLADEITQEISNTLIIETLLLDWKGMPGVDGTEVAYSKPEVKCLLEDKELKDLKAEILEMADDNARFQIAYEEELIED